MKRRLVLLLLVAALATGAFAANGWFDDFESPAAPYDPIVDTADWGTDKGWSTWFVSAGSGEGSSQGCGWGGSNWYIMSAQSGVAAPQNPGDWVVVEARFKITVGSADISDNTYIWNFGIETDPDHTVGAGVECIMTRRNQDNIGAAATGDGQSWDLFGWQANSTIGLSSGKDATSDWFGNRITVTMEEGGTYTVYTEITKPDGEMLTENTNIQQELPTMAAAPIWYARIGMQALGINDADVTAVTMDNVAIYNNKHTDDPVAHTPTPEDGDTAVDSETLSSVAWEAPLTGSDPNSNDPNLVSVDKFDITYYILDNDAVGDDDPNWIDNGTKYENVANPYTDAAIVAMTYEQTMFWRVDTQVTWDSNDFTGDGGLTSIEEGNSWSFTTKPAYLPPVVSANDVITTVALTSGGNVAALSAEVEDNSEPITSVSFTLLTDDIDFPVGSDAALSDTTSDNQNPTAELTTTMEGFYKVKLEISDGTTDLEEIIAVNVYADACQAKKDSPTGWTANYYDSDDDCDVDVVDFAALALEWLDDTSMQAQEDADYGAGYVPQDVFDARIEAEWVDPNDPNACSDGPISDDNGIRLQDQENASGGSSTSWASDGAWIEYAVDVPPSAVGVAVDVYAGYALNTGSTTISFGVDGDPAAYGTGVFPSTGNWTSFTSGAKVGEVTFTSSGSQIVRTTYGGGLNLDWFSFDW